MPAKSGAQQRAAGMALSIARGKVPAHKACGPVRQMLKGMSEKQLKEFAAHKKMRG